MIKEETLKTKQKTSKDEQIPLNFTINAYLQPTGSKEPALNKNLPKIEKKNYRL